MPDDYELDAALEHWESLRDEEGPESADAYLTTLPEALRASVESRIAPVLAAEAALLGCDQNSAPHNAEPAAAGCVGRYEIIGLHAHGGMGDVYRARDVELGRVVAYKVMKHSYRGDPEARTRFYQEAEVTSKLQHPGIVPVLGLVEDGSGLPAYAMEFVEGSTLFEAIREFHQGGTPSDARTRLRRRNELLRHFIAACRVVAFAHDRGYVHGDIKPQNILIDSYGATRVVDWGVSRFVPPEGDSAGIGEDVPTDRISRRITSRRFHGPSARDPGVPATFASDVWAVGATLMMLMTGQPPPDRPRDVERALATLPRALAAVCRKAMHAGRGDRYVSLSALADDVERFIDDEPVSVYREPWQVRLRRWISRHKTSSVAALLTVLFACFAVTGGTLAKSSLDRSARRAQERVRFEEGRAPFEVLLTLGIVEYLAKDKPLATQTYDGLAQKLSSRLASEFANDMDTALLGWCYYYRGYVECPGPAPKGHGANASDMTTMERLVTLYRTGGLLNSLMATLNRPAAANAEAWFDKAVQTFDCIRHWELLTEKERDAHKNSLVGRAAMPLQLGRSTEALMDWDRMLSIGVGKIPSYFKANRTVIRMAAEQEQANPAWSRPPKAYEPKTLEQATYLATADGVSDAAVYNAACVYSLASIDDKVTSEERNRRQLQAINYLSRIANNGYFKGGKQGRELRTDQDLDPLRGRAEFQAIIAKAP